MAVASDCDIQVDDHHSRIKVTAEKRSARIEFTRVEIDHGDEYNSKKISFWYGEHYQGTLDINDQQIYYANEGVALRIKIPIELVEQITAEMTGDE